MVREQLDTTSSLSCDGEGYVTTHGGDPVDVPDDLRELAREVDGTCPESAITVTDD